ncbi:MAG: putative UDP-N-acetylbacillosamine N-acetyltransferase [Nitrospira sp.]|nr:MAG: putative UDP-N-acetylbacillosamine N-acetyltransferase [Nitrospira sp.]
MSKKLLIFPFGGNGKESLISILAINEVRPEWEVIGFIDDNHSLHGQDYSGVKVLGGRELFQSHRDAYVLAVPGSPNGYLRRRFIIESLGIQASRFATIIHPSVVKAPDAVVGHNTLLMPHVVVSCGVRIGNHCVVLPNTVIAHDTMIGDYCCIGSNVSLSGGVNVGVECYIGSGVKIRENVHIGDRTLVGLGSNVVCDIPEDIVVVGNPAREIRKITSG